MKQVTKTQAVVDRLRAAYGAGADISNLAVFKVEMANSLPLRKSGGLYKKGTISAETLAQMAAAVRAESIPVNGVHGETNVAGVVGRVFDAEVQGGVLVGLTAIDGTNHGDIVAKMDNGTIDQVSIGMLPLGLQCSACGFDFMGPDATLDNLWSATCANDHVMGSDDAHTVVSGLDLFYELSLVPMGAAQGARVVDASQSTSEPLRLAATAKGNFALELSPTPKDPSTLDTTAFTAAITASAIELGSVKAELSAKDVALTAAATETAALREEVTTLKAKVTELSTGEVATLKNQAEEATAQLSVAKDHLKAEAGKILTACGIKDHSVIPDDIAGITALIDEKRAAFAAAIPTEARSQAAVGDTKDPASMPRPTGAFSAPRR